MDRLEELVEHGRRWPLGDRVLIDRRAFLNLIDQMRISAPQEMRRSQEFWLDREKFIAQAQADARTILEQAHEDAARLLDEQAIKRQAELDARRILERAGSEARETRAGADAYAEQVLRQLDRHIRQVNRTIQNGLRELAGLRAPADGSAGDAETEPSALGDLPVLALDEDSSGDDRAAE